MSIKQKQIYYGFVQPKLSIVPTTELVFVGNSESLMATLTLTNEHSAKRLAVKLKTNLPVNSISVKPKKVIIEPLQKVSKKEVCTYCVLI